MPLADLAEKLARLDLASATYAQEVAESEAKLIPMRDALAG